MRKAVVVGLSIAAFGCNSDRLTGASAQRAVAQGQAQFAVIPESVVVFVDDVRQQTGTALALRAETVERVEVLKGALAVARFGPQATGGAIFIFTKRTR